MKKKKKQKQKTLVKNNSRHAITKWIEQNLNKDKRTNNRQTKLTVFLPTTMIRRIWSLNPISNLNEKSLSLSLFPFSNKQGKKKIKKKTKKLTFLNPTPKLKKTNKIILPRFLFVLF